MTNELTLKEYLTSDLATNQLKTYLGEDEAKVKKFATSVLIKVMGNDKLQSCSNESILTACIDAINLGLTVDNRDHAYLVPYGGQAKLQIGYKGYIYKIKQKMPDVDFQVGLVFEGDNFGDIETNNGIDSFRHQIANPFQTDFAKLQGGYCYITYYQNGERKGKLTSVAKSELDEMKKSSKTGGAVWAKWQGEMIKKSIVRRACKMHFAGIVDELDEADNSNFVFDSDDAKPIKSENVAKLSDKMKEKAVTKPVITEVEDILQDNIPEFVEAEIVEPTTTKKEAKKDAKKATSTGGLF